MDTKLYQKYSVVVNGGSGVLIQPQTSEYSYVLTAKHNFTNNGKTNGDLSTDYKDIIIKRNSTDAPSLNIRKLFIHEDNNKDIAIVQIDKIEDDIKLKATFCSLNDTVYLFGYPKRRDKDFVNYDRIKHEITNEKDNHVFDITPIQLTSNSDENTKDVTLGFSGGGIFKEINEEIFLVGIENRIADKTASSDKLRFTSINCFQEIIKENGLHEIPFQLITHPEIIQTNKSFEDEINNNIIFKKIIAKEIGQIFDNILKNENSLLFLTGKAGGGKSVALTNIIYRLKDENIPYLFFRIDRLNFHALPQTFAKQNFNMDDSPEIVLAREVQNHKCVLIIDQIDTVSTVSGRHPEFFDCISQIINSAIKINNMHVIVACRKFDIENDDRFRKISKNKQQFTIDELSEENVKNTLSNANYDYTKLSKKQIQLLKLPIYLSLFVLLHEENSEINLKNIETGIDLFDKYWKLKKHKINSDIDIENIVEKISFAMYQNQSLSINEQEFLKFTSLVNTLISEGLLTRHNNQLSFFHETFFDYIFARKFISEGNDLLSFIKKSNQELFMRSLIRQILFLLYHKNLPFFITTIDNLFTDEHIRFHLKLTTLNTLSIIDIANDNIWGVLSKHLNTNLEFNIWRVIYPSNNWFLFLISNGFLKKELTRFKECKFNNVITIISENFAKSPEECFELLYPYINIDTEWNDLILRLISFDKVYKHEKIFKLLKLILQSNNFSSNTIFKNSIRELNEHNKHKWAIDIFYICVEWNFKNKIETYNPDNEKYFFTCKDYESNAIISIAEKEPVEFFERISPLFFKLIKKFSSKNEKDSLLYDTIWKIRSYGTFFLSLDDVILCALERSLQIIAQKHTAESKNILDKLLKYGYYESVTYLLMRMFKFSHQEYSNTAIDYIISNPPCLKTSWAINGADYWVAREALENISKYCSKKSFGDLCNSIKDYYPRFELGRDGYKYKMRGLLHFIHFTVLPIERLDNECKKYLGELNRKFLKYELSPPEPMEAKIVSSPIDSNKTDRMTDDEWFTAIKKYDKKKNIQDFFKGGAHQLSGELQRLTKTNPIRFSKLALKFEDDFNESYFNSILIGLKESKCPPNQAFKVIEYFYSMQKKPGMRWVPFLLSNFISEEIPVEILNIIKWCAIDNNDTEDDLLINGTGDLLATAINSTTGTSVEFVGKLLGVNEKYYLFFKEYIPLIIQTGSPSTLTVAGLIIYNLYRYDKSTAIDLLFTKRIIDNSEVLQTHYYKNFMFFLVYEYQNLPMLIKIKLQYYISCFRFSKNENLKKFGMSLTCGLSFNSFLNELYIFICKKISKTLRQSMADVFSKNVTYKPKQHMLISNLIFLFNDKDKEIRNKASNCMFKLKDRIIDENSTRLIKKFIQSNSFIENSRSVVNIIKNSNSHIPDLLFQTAEKMTDILESNNEDSTIKIHYESREIMELVLRAYRQENTIDLKIKCLDIIDKLLSYNSYEAEKKLEEMER